MRLYLPVLTCLLSLLASLGSADTTTNLHSVFTFMPTPRYPLDAYERRSDGWRPIEGVQWFALHWMLMVRSRLFR